MNLAIFDLDGTLTDTNRVDWECFIGAWQSECGIDCSQLNWSEFEHVTDRAIAAALATRHFHSAHHHSVLRRVQSRFIDLLSRAASERPNAFRPIEGALRAVTTLPSQRWNVAIATGAWSQSARIKLRAAGFPDAIPLSSSDCCASRHQIVSHAIAIAERAYLEKADRIVLLGDAAWDVATAVRLRLPFVGIAQGEQAAEMRRLGAAAVIPDFTDLAALHAALLVASVPDPKLASQPANPA